MKQLLLTTVAFLICIFSVQAERYYVTENGQGLGTSWEDAMSSLTTALELAQDGDEIWVATGTYFPTQANDRDQSFEIPSGVQVLGGFAGTEETLADRDLTKGTSVLSGEIGDKENLEDNTYTIVYFEGATSTTLLNGFTITAAYANGLVEGVDRKTCGGAIFNNGDQQFSSPQISQCIFLNNFSREGAAIYNYANEGITNPTLSDCKFLFNRSDFNGGAIFNDGNFGKCNPSIKNCLFEGNESMYGAGVLNRGLYGECKAVITNCIFLDNFSIVRGGAIYNLREGRGICDATTSGCMFDGNGATIGNGDIEQTIKIGTEIVPAASKGSGIRKRKTSTIAY